MNKTKKYENASLDMIKSIINENINAASKSFVIIGYYLKDVRDRELYITEGCQSVWEFAQKEFNISKSSSSRFMAINDKFSDDGNSPVLMEKYKDFGSSKLQEMLTLSDEQIEQVSVSTTIAEIREIKKPDKSVATSQQEPVISEEEKLLNRCNVLKEMCNCICKMSAYLLEKNKYSMEAICQISTKDYGFGFGDEEGYSKYQAECKNSQYIVSEFKGINKWVFEAGEVEQLIWNFNGRDWCNKHQNIQNTYEQEVKVIGNKKVVTIDDLELPVRTYNCLKRENIDAVDKLCMLTEEELMQIKNISQKSVNEIVKKLGGIGISLKDKDLEIDLPEVIELKPNIRGFMDNPYCPNCDSAIDYKSDCKSCGCLIDWTGLEKLFEFEEEQIAKVQDDVEIIEADIVETEVVETENSMIDIVETDILDSEIVEIDTEQIIQEDPEQIIETDQEPNVKLYARYALEYFAKKEYADTDFYLFNARKWLADNYDYDRIAPPDYFNDNRKPQLELPMLKNNDLRRDWIDNYQEWPVWIEVPQTEERYYRYDFSNGTSFIVRVSMVHKWISGKYSKEEGWGNEEYFLLGKEDKDFKSGKTFKEFSTNKTDMIDHLKDIQKKR
ncbi:MAG: DNA-directed RNA polymerase subunit alpha C-terminal domain-containing protein [Lachnotalea sp.]